MSLCLVCAGSNLKTRLNWMVGSATARRSTWRTSVTGSEKMRRVVTHLNAHTVPNAFERPALRTLLDPGHFGSFRPFLCCLGIVLFLLLGLANGALAAPPPRPNIIFILMDDLRWDEMDYPFVKAPS